MKVSRRRFVSSTGILAAAALGRPISAFASQSGDFAGFLEQVRVKFGVPGLAVLVRRQGAIERQLAVGVRARGGPSAVTIDDKWHLGSCLKAMTATMLARLVERGALAWSSTPTAIFPRLAAKFDPTAGAITLDQLLTMTAGLAENRSNTLGLNETIAELRKLDVGSLAEPERRLEVVRTMLSQPLRAQAGTRAVYSNTGYIIAGAMAETVTGKPFETLIAEEVFGPLGMVTTGFGAPGSGATPDQPRGHFGGANSPPLSPDSIEADLPSVYRPAGGAHMGLRDWALFVDDAMAGARGGGRLLRPESCHHLLRSPHLGPLGPYASGWAVMQKDETVIALTHNGSNLRWFTRVNAYPARETHFLIATNQGGTAAEKALDTVKDRLKQELALSP